jgi:hypothetical protein
MADQELKILIKTIYDGRGAQLSAQDIEKLQKAAESGSKEAAEAVDQLSQSYKDLASSASSASETISAAEKARIDSRRSTGRAIADVHEESLRLQKEREQKRIEAQDKAAVRQHSAPEFTIQDAIQQTMQRRELEEAEREKAQRYAIVAGRKISPEQAHAESLLAITNEQIRVNESQRRAAAERKKKKNPLFNDPPDSPNDPPDSPNDPSNKGGDSSYAARRHFGAVAGQILGLPGLGMAAAIGGITAAAGVAAIALHKLVTITQEWNEKINAMAEANRLFETAAQRADTLANQVRRVADHNKDLALTYAQIERQVRTTSAAVSHYMELQQAQLAFEQRLDEASVERMSRENDIRNRFNPIARIKEQEAIEEAAHRRRIEREREAERNAQRALELQKELAAARQAHFAERTEQLNQIIPQAERDADVAKRKADDMMATTGLQKSEAEKERQLVQDLVSGVANPRTWLAKYMTFRAKTPGDLNPSTDASEMLLGKRGGTTEEYMAAAEVRLKELNDASAEADRTGLDAAQLARTKAARAARLTRERDMYEQDAHGSAVEQSKAAFELEQKKKLQEQSSPMRDAAEQERIRSLQKGSEFKILNEFLSMPISAPGTASTGDKDAIKLLEQIASNQQQLLNEWRA